MQSNRRSHSKVNTIRNGNLIIIQYFPKNSQKISKILLKFDIKVVFTPFNKIHFTNLKHRVDRFSHWGIYRMSCECDKMYIGQMKRYFNVCMVDHKTCVKNCNIKCSAIA